VVVADDNADMRQYIVRLLSALYTVEAVADGEAALEAVRKQPPDLVLSDVMMPRLDGFGLLHELRADPRTAALPIILLSARAGEESRVEGMEAGADDYLVKPFSARELVARVSAHLEMARIRKEAKKTLQRAEERMRLITDALPTLISYVDVDGIYRLNNRAYEEWFRHNRDEVTGRHMADVLGESAWAIIGPKVRAAFEGATVNYEAEVDYKDAGKRWIDATYVPHFENGEVIGLFVLVNDITDRKKAEQAIRESEAQFRNMADNAPAILWVTVPSGECTYLSALWYEFTGRTRGEDVGYAWLEAIHPDDLAETKRIFREANEGQIPFRIDYRLRRHDGEYRWAVDAGLPRFNGSVFQGFVGCVFDVHERKLAEAANSRLVQDLRHADQRKDEFLATLAHELRNPLAPIRNGLQIMQLAKDDPEATEQARSMMERQLGQMVHLVDDLLDLSRISRGKIELRKKRIDLAKVIQQAIETSRPAIEQAGHELLIEVPARPAYVDADLTRLAQVFSNLLNNAAKYTESGGRIRLAVHYLESQAVISVRDNGIGIPAHMLPHVFEMFTQVDRNLERSQGGLGIGLSIVKRLVEMHDGAVEARSEGHGMGSEFVVYLPAEFSVISLVISVLISGRILGLHQRAGG
jgi:PAS domain S-box-containing protein